MTKNQNNTQDEQQQEAAMEPQQQVQQEPVKVVYVEKPKNGFTTWLKDHWKGLAAGAVGLGLAGGTSVLAYRKGKQANAAVNNCYQSDEDYSLDPNR